MKRLLFLLILLCGSIHTLYAQEVRTINGRVTDAEGLPLIGASVFISPDEESAKDYKPQGTVTDYDGNFLYTFPQSVHKLVVSYIGFQAQTINLSPDKSVYNVRLQEDTQTFSEVVVTGYQKIEKRKVTSAVNTVKVDELKQIAVPTVDQLLAGQATGVSITPVSGAPGEQAQIRIRGTATLNGNREPLWVLDGIPLEGNDIPTDINSQEVLDQLRYSSIAGLNPADIEDITILKDAAATAIYGARAANGVIVITSKRGKEGRMTVNFNSGVFFTSRPDAARLHLLDANQKVDLELSLLSNPHHRYRSDNGDVARLINEAGATDLFKEKGFGALPGDLQGRINALRSQSTDWFREIYAPTVNQQYGLSLRGGSEKAKYYISGGYYDEKGTTKGTSFTRYNLTSNTDFDITSKVTLSLSLFANRSDKSTYLTEGVWANPQRYTRNANPYRRIYNADGSYVYDPDVKVSSEQSIRFNYAEEMKNTSYDLTNQSFKSVADLSWKPLQELTFTSQFGLQFENGSTEKFGDKDSFYSRYYRQRFIFKDESVLPEGGIIQNWNSNFFQYNWKNQAFYHKVFDHKHDVDLMAGTEMRRNYSTMVHTKGFGFDRNSMSTKPVVFPEGYSSVDSPMLMPYLKQYYENAFVSFFTTASYTLADKYTFFGSLRYDGSNLFGVDPQYRYLPIWSVSGAWNIGREDFIQKLGWVYDAKVRASYGIQGNVDRQTSPFVKGEWKNVTIFPRVTEPKITVLNPPNRNLRWEKTATTNLGADISLLQSRVNLSFDYYYRKSTDLISQKKIPQENGFDVLSINFGSVENKGWELSLNTTNISTKDWTWTTNFNISRNKSLVLEYNAGEMDFTPTIEGHSVNALFAIPTAGLDKDGLMQFRAKDGSVKSLKEYYHLTKNVWGTYSTSLSSEEFRDLFIYIGDRDPKLYGGFSSTLRYRDFDFTLSSNFFLHKMVQRQAPYRPTSFDPAFNATAEVFKIWSPDNPEGIYPRILGGEQSGSDGSIAYNWINGQDPSSSYALYDIWYKDMSYWRINSLRLGYTLYGDKLKTKWFRSLKLTVEARNPFVVSTDYAGYFDPESYGNIYSQPMARTISFGLNATF